MAHIRILTVAGAVVAAGVLLGLLAQADQEPRPLHVVIALGPGKEHLAKFQDYLQTHYYIQCNWVEAEKAKPDAFSDFKGIQHLADADVILSNLYRTSAAPEPFAVLKKHFLGKPVVGLRKAHHGFQNWLEADREVFGVRYRGHYFGKNVAMAVVDKHTNNPLFTGLKTFLPAGGLYAHTDLADDIEVYMAGGPEGKEPMPQTWSRTVKNRGQRVFYTRYDPADLHDGGVRDMVVRAIFWAAQRDEQELKRQP